MNILFKRLKSFPFTPIKQITFLSSKCFANIQRNEYLQKILTEIENSPSDKSRIKYAEPFVNEYIYTYIFYLKSFLF